MIERDVTLYDLDQWFNYQTPESSQIPRFLAVREAGGAFAQAILENTPPGPEQRDAIERVRVAVMVANQSIVFERHEAEMRKRQERQETEDTAVRAELAGPVLSSDA